jgi:hypothetical protein
MEYVAAATASGFCLSDSASGRSTESHYYTGDFYDLIILGRNAIMLPSFRLADMCPRIGRMEVGNKVSYDSCLHSFLGRLLRAWVHVPLYGALLLLESVPTPSLHILLLLAMVNQTT